MNLGRRAAALTVANMAYAQIDVNPEERRLVHDLASLISVTDPMLECYFTIQAAVVDNTDLFSTGVPGHKISASDPQYCCCPFVLHRREGGDIIVGAFKHRGGVVYYYGVPSERVKSFKPPVLPAVFDEESTWLTAKVSSSMACSISVLENTESAKLLDNFNEILKLTSIFKAVKLSSSKAMAKWAGQTAFTTVVKAVMTAAEGRARIAAKAKGLAAGPREGQDVSQGGGVDARDRWTSARASLLKQAEFYAFAFAERFFTMENADALAACVADLEKHPLKEWLLPGLAAHAAALRSKGFEAAPPQTPLKQLLELPPPKPTAAAAAAAAAADADDDDDDDDDDAEDAAATATTKDAAAPATAPPRDAAAAAAAEGAVPTEPDAAAAKGAVPAEPNADSAPDGARQRRARTPKPPPPQASATDAKPKPKPGPRSDAKPKPKPVDSKKRKIDEGPPGATPVGRQKNFPESGANWNFNHGLAPTPTPILTLILTPTLTLRRVGHHPADRPDALQDQGAQ